MAGASTSGTRSQKTSYSAMANGPPALILWHMRSISARAAEVRTLGVVNISRHTRAYFDRGLCRSIHMIGSFKRQHHRPYTRRSAVDRAQVASIKAASRARPSVLICLVVSSVTRQVLHAECHSYCMLKSGEDS